MEHHQNIERHLKPARIFGDGMVLQRGKPLPIWGTAEPGQSVAVDFQEVQRETTAGPDGQWRLELPPLDAARNGTLRITSGEEELIFSDVAVGEVWLAGGQSNMEFPMDYEKSYEAECLTCCDPDIRFYDTPKACYPGELEAHDYAQFGVWRRCDRENLRFFSAVGYHFAKELRRGTDVPIGIVGCNWGGTGVTCWMPEEETRRWGGGQLLAEYEEGQKGLDIARYEREYLANPENDHSQMYAIPKGIPSYLEIPWETQLEQVAKHTGPEPLVGPWDPCRPAGLYREMLCRTTPYALRGFLFYQGESDAGHPQLYEDLLTGMIRCWRDLWGEELPFLMVQLAPFDAWMGCSGGGFPGIRKAQQAVADRVEGVYLASTGDAGCWHDIHPKDKRPVGQRLGLLARHHVYGQELDCDAPRFRHARWLDGQTLALEFFHVGHFDLRGSDIQALSVWEGNRCVTQQCAAAPVDNCLRISFPKPPQSEIRIYYAQSPYYCVNLYSKAGLPALPFEARIVPPEVSRRVIPYEPKYRVAVQQICLDVAGEDCKHDPDQSRFLLAMYCDCYLDHGTVFVLTDGLDQPKGYIFCAEDFTAHSAAMAPYLKIIGGLGGIYPLMARAELATYEKYAGEYPAHLHIDILEEYTGGGSGKALMNALLAHLRSRGVSGVMLQVSAQNRRAIGYYQKTGFSVLEENEHFLVLGQKLK